MVDTAGTKLKRARKLRKLGLEDVSRVTKIRVGQLADLENDDYSNFANLAYAKSFLMAYAKYLHVDTRPYLDAFADAGTFGLDDYQYLSETPVGIYRAQHRRQTQLKPKRQQFVLAAVALALLTIVGVGWFAEVSYERLGGDLDKLAARQEARDHASSQASSQPAAVNARSQASEAVVPVADPRVIPVNNATPAPSVAPMDEAERTAAGALASLNMAVPTAPQILPLLGDGNAVRQILQPLAKHPVAAVQTGRLVDALPRDGSEPQKVVNNQPRE